MSWGPGFFYYRCSRCGKKFKYAQDMIPVFGAQFGNCPECGIPGEYLFDGARTPDDLEYEEIDE
ncbi:MAG: excinuclease ATPase subunit [Clostridia bacterium]|nr:excinuclease ATPase subunit [Clostridia bacterium]